MRCRVFWSPYAEEKLESLLRNASGPDVIAAAAREIDRFLSSMPETFGESRYDTMRVAFVFPLGVQFEVMNDVQTVIVHDAWRIDRKESR